MQKPDIDTSEEKLREIVAALPIFAADLRNDLREIMLAFQRLGQTWLDDEYEQFRRCIPPLTRIIDEMVDELSRQRVSLERDLENLARIRGVKQ